MPLYCGANHTWSKQPINIIPTLTGMNYQHERAYILMHFQHYRIAQPTVVFLHGLNDALSSPQVIRRQVEKFGGVLRVSCQRVGKDFHSAFIQLEEQVNAGLLILLLDGHQLMNRTLRVFYGSTKFCPHYLKGHHCRMKECNYAHYYHPLLVHLRDQAKDIDQLGIAKQLVLGCLNYPDVLIRVSQELHQKQNPKDLLPLNIEKYHALLSSFGILLPIPTTQTQISLHTEEKGEMWSETEITEGQLSELTHEKDEWWEIDSAVREQEDTLGEVERRLPSPHIQEFLDGAERFLTKLIFHSSQFVY